MIALKSQSLSDSPLTDQLQHRLVALGFPVSPILVEAFLDYLALLIRWNRVYNLTAVLDPEEMITKHFMDCLAVIPYLPAGRIIDVGSGAGLPALPLALACPDRHITALDSNSKKTRFMTQVKVVLQQKTGTILNNLFVVHHRVETYQSGQHYEAVIARAYATLSELIVNTWHLLAPKGVWLAMKGIYPHEELDDLIQLSKKKELQVTLRTVIPLQIPGLEAERHLVVLEKS